MTDEYDLGYFEGVRNVMVAYIRMPDKEQWFTWLTKELDDAKRLRDEE